MAQKPPPCMWAERKDRLFITVELIDCGDATVDFSEDKIAFKGTGKKGDSDPAEHAFTLELNGKIKPEESTFKATDRAIEILGVKKEAGAYWEKLVTQPNKVTKAWLTTNWALFCEEDDEDAAANAKVAGFGGYGDRSRIVPAEDSDDEGVDDRPADVTDIMG
ncbi:hypothetical protein DIPPA_16257 [Diplonema papillatum]|nr:hypothetical protein DIPPA_16257 [Diplonema papillatum]